MPGEVEVGEEEEGKVEGTGLLNLYPPVNQNLHDSLPPGLESWGAEGGQGERGAGIQL